jgi:tripartite-type tricarboxylate transporter receptor subunit TctC
MVPFPPGGSVDIIARIIQPSLERALGRPVVIDNRAGASGIIGTNVVAKATPDGYTLLIVASTHTINPALNTKLPYDTEHDLAPVALVAKNAFFFLVNPKVPAATISEFLTLAKAEPGKLNYASPGATSQARLVVEVLSQRAGIKLQHVPYRGSAQMITATLAGDVQLAVLSPLTSLSKIQDGSVRLIGTGGLARDPQFPDVPTVAESGLPGFEANQWFGLFTTAGTSKEVVKRLNIEVNKILQQPDTAAKLSKQGVVPGGGTVEEFSALVSTEIRGFIDAARLANIGVE